MVVMPDPPTKAGATDAGGATAALGEPGDPEEQAATTAATTTQRPPATATCVVGIRALAQALRVKSPKPPVPGTVVPPRGPAKDARRAAGLVVAAIRLPGEGRE